MTFGLDAFTPDWVTRDGDKAPGWYRSGQNQWPGVALGNGTFYMSTAPAGHMVNYPPAAVKWTAPRATTVSIQGAAWNLRGATTLAIAVNGSKRLNVWLNGRTFSNPYTFNLPNIAVAPGDTIMLLNGPTGDYMGFDLTIQESTSGTLAGTLTSSWDNHPSWRRCCLNHFSDNRLTEYAFSNACISLHAQRTDRYETANAIVTLQLTSVVMRAVPTITSPRRPRRRRREPRIRQGK